MKHLQHENENGGKNANNLFGSRKSIGSGARKERSNPTRDKHQMKEKITERKGEEEEEASFSVVLPSLLLNGMVLLSPRSLVWCWLPLFGA